MLAIALTFKGYETPRNGANLSADEPSVVAMCDSWNEFGICGWLFECFFAIEKSIIKKSIKI